MHQWKDKRVVVLGLGDTGLSMTRWLARRGARVSVADTRERPPHAATLAAELPDLAVATGAFDDALFAGVDAIAVSPGIDRRHGPIGEAARRGVPVVGDIELFIEALPALAKERRTARPKVLAVTGSNGKSTVTAMTGAACSAAGRTTIVAGNIGVPVLDALAEIEGGAPLPQVFALELSSFQLESTSTLDADAATVLNVTEDHLDRYDGMAEYVMAKSRVFRGRGAQVLNRLDRWSMGMERPGRAVVTFGIDAPSRDVDWGIVNEATLVRGRTALMDVGELAVAGLHNAANALAALALGNAIGLKAQAMLDGVRQFRGLPHRLEKVGEIRGIAFYDDSKGTNVGATVAALNGMTTPVVLIAGGDGKGQDFTPLEAAVRSRARSVVLIGRDGPAIEQVLNGAVPVARAATMDEAVETAFRLAHAGEAVLLSPACASYDMFRSYVHRGEVFVEAVRALSTREEGAR